MAFVSKKMVKFQGKWYRPGQPFPSMTKAQRKSLIDNGDGEDAVTEEEARAATAMQEKVANLKAEVEEAEAQSKELEEVLASEEDAKKALTNARRAATVANNGDDADAKEKAAAAVAAAEAEVERVEQAKEAFSKLQDLLAGKTAALKELT